MNCLLTTYSARRAQRGVLFVSASLIAIAVASSDVRAADLTPRPTKAPLLVKAPPRPVAHDVWTWWAEGGFTGQPASDPALGLLPFGPFANLNPGTGWEAAVGFDYMAAQFSPYHISGQVRWGQNRGASTLWSRNNLLLTLMTPGGATAPAITNTNGSATLDKEDHWLVDFAIGRDFALGSGNVQAKLGIRVAEISSSGSGTGALLGCAFSTTFPPVCFTPVIGKVSFQSRSRFLGAGPRIGIDGSQPFGGSWAFDYLGGVAVLFGSRSLNASQSFFATTTSFTPPYVLNSVASLSTSNSVAIFNLDAQAGISYWFTRNFKLTASYRFDGYWNALMIVEPTGQTGTQNRFYYGPMLRATVAIP